MCISELRFPFFSLAHTKIVSFLPQDLKKQTAIRLAKEQHQNDEISFTHDRSRSDFGPRQARGNHAVSPVPYPSRAFPQEEVEVGTPANYYGANNQINRVNSVSYTRDLNTAPTPVTTSDVPNSKTQPRYAPEKQRMTAPSPSNSSSAAVDTSVKAKLPHGLTVHELKAMTKARLQAEAIEKRTDMRSPGSFVPVPTQVAPEIRERVVRSPIVPLQNNFSTGHPPSMTEGNLHQESWSRDSRNDHWETGSVSTQTSDYFGSEKGFAPLEDNVYGNRARSFSANNAVGQDFRRDSPSPVISHPVSYYDSYTPNRRRAATLSPRAGLSHLHENHPLVGEPQLPAFSSFNPPHAEAIAPRNMSPAFETFYSSIHEEANRARTSSTASMPSISHTSEEFAHRPSVARFGSVLEDVSPVTGLSDAFRIDSDLSSFHGLGENRTRASTWAATSGVNDLFGPSLIGNTPDTTNEISDELASILKLSGAEDRDAPSEFPSWM